MTSRPRAFPFHHCPRAIVSVLYGLLAASCNSPGRSAGDLDASQAIQAQALTLDVYDEFDGSLSTQKWTTLDGNPTTSGGRLRSDARTSSTGNSALRTVDLFDGRSLLAHDLREDPGTGRCWVMGYADADYRNGIVIRRDLTSSSVSANVQDHLFFYVKQGGQNTVLRDLGPYGPGSPGLDFATTWSGTNLEVVVKAGSTTLIDENVDMSAFAPDLRFLMLNYCGSSVSLASLQATPAAPAGAMLPYDTFEGSTSSQKWSLLGGVPVNSNGRLRLNSQTGSDGEAGVISTDLFDGRSVAAFDFHEEPSAGNCWFMGYADPGFKVGVLVGRGQNPNWQPPVIPNNLFLIVFHDGLTEVLRDLGPYGPASPGLNFLGTWMGTSLDVLVKAGNTTLAHQTFDTTPYRQGIRFTAGTACSGNISLASLQATTYVAPAFPEQSTVAWQTFDEFDQALSTGKWTSTRASATGGRLVLDATASGSLADIYPKENFERRSVRIKDLQEAPNTGKCWSAGYMDAAHNGVFVTRGLSQVPPLIADDAFLEVWKAGALVLRRDLGPFFPGVSMDFTGVWSGTTLKVEVKKNGLPARYETILNAPSGTKLRLQSSCGANLSVERIEAGPPSSCAGQPNGVPCDDRDLCTVGDTCQAGLCGKPVVCAAADLCHVAGTCDPSTGQCAGGGPRNCDDGKICTTDFCLAALGGCVNEARPICDRTADLCSPGDLGCGVAAPISIDARSFGAGSMVVESLSPSDSSVLWSVTLDRSQRQSLELRPGILHRIRLEPLGPVVPFRVGADLLLQLDPAVGATGAGTKVLTLLDQEEDRARFGPCADWPRTTDADGDGLDDNHERCVIEANAPIFNFHVAGNLEERWPLSPIPWADHEIHWPVNVDYFLERTELWFSHPFCGDHQVSSRGQLDQSTLTEATDEKLDHHANLDHTITCMPNGHVARPTDVTWDFEHSTDVGWDEDQHYYLSVNDSDHIGAPPAFWKVYSHVYPNDFGGVDVQYWLIFAWDDGHLGDPPLGGNHQGDWEGITVRRYGGTGAVKEVVMGGHGIQHRFERTGVERWFPNNTDGQHPHVWVAEGSHAMYPSEQACDDEEIFQVGPIGVGPGCEGGFYQWRTWERLVGFWDHPATLDATGEIVNVGEVDQRTNGTDRLRPINGQNFIRANIKWGAGDGPRPISWFGAWMFKDLPPALPPPCVGVCDDLSHWDCTTNRCEPNGQ